jgi:hypothetical protein
MIHLDKSTRQRLRELGKFGDSYDSIINRLIEEHLAKPQ